MNFVTFKTNFYNNASQYYPQAVLLNPYGNDDTIPGHNGPQAPITNISYERAVYSTYVTGGVNYNGDNVPYVPEETFNLGAYYNLLIGHITYSPKIWDIYTGKQHIMDDVTGAPSHQTIPSFNVLNASISAKVPFQNQRAGLT